MTLANTCVLVASLLPIATMGLAKFASAGRRRAQGGYDNNNPRAWAAQQTGWKARAAAAQNNGFEILPLFIFAVLVAQAAGLPQPRTDQLALGFIASRLVYTAVYLADLGAIRSLIWAVGMGLAIAIMAPTLSWAL